MSCILAARLLLSTHFFLTCLWFSSVVFKGPAGTSSALCFQVSKMLRSERSKAAYTELFKSCAWEHFPEWAGASRSLFFPARETCAMFHLVLYMTSSFENALMQYRSLWKGEMQSCVSLLSVWFLQKRVFKIYVLNGFLFCIPALAMWLSWPSVYQSLIALNVGLRSSGTVARFLFHERNAASLTFLMVWILYHLCMFANIKLLPVFRWAFFILNFICLQIYFFNKSSKPSFST